MTEYTPSDEDVRTEYLLAHHGLDAQMDAGEAFDRWLAAHDARVRRDAAREALGGLQSFARDCMFSSDLGPEEQAGWHFTWAAAISHRATHYPHPEESP